LSNFEISGNVAAGILEHPVEEIYEGGDVQKMPSFPGGEAELLQYLNRNIRYPEMAREAGVEGPVVLSFVVAEDGTVSHIALLKDPGASCGKEAIRVLSTMPKWIPGEANGRPVKVRFYLPVRFELK
jgi:protein TonB